MATGGSGQIIDIFGYRTGFIFIREKTRKLRKIKGGKKRILLIFRRANPCGRTFRIRKYLGGRQKEIFWESNS